ncbi:MAG: HD domain-containing phosphohydrolase [Sulfuricellaceae bacterium]|nr:HD domain-containing phosphohydrolase [Sulfuricellaceae bacterium]
MANIQALTRPRVFDQESLEDFVNALSDRAPEIEKDMARLAKAPTDRVVIADLFRSLHNIKGDAALCKLEIGIQVTHPIESLLTRLRAKELSYSPLLGEVILLAIDRLELAMEALMARRPLGQLKLVALVEGLERLAVVPQAEMDGLATRIVKDVTGFQPSSVAKRVSLEAIVRDVPESADSGDLVFFRLLALQFESRSPFFLGRTERLLELATDTNQQAGSPVNAMQLEAAVYLHDIGMMFLPESTWFKSGKMSVQERLHLHQHPLFSAGLLERMPGWSEAAEMVRQHHEMPDGGGYPGGLSDDVICPGARILAIIDAFESVTLKHSERGQKRSILRAIAEVNACDKQFAPEWIEPFNAVVRRMLES